MLKRFARALKTTLKRSLAVLKPPADLTVSEWSDRYRMLSPEASAAPGKWRTDKAEYQRGIMDAFSDPYVETVVIMSSAQVGKALALDTPIPTPYGWSTMGDLRVGDEVFDEQGRVCRVTYVTPVMEDRNCYMVEFSDGAAIVADAEHQWWVESDTARPGVGVVTTAHMAATAHYGKGGRRNRYAVPVAAPIDCAKVELPVDPYVLGAWLGDGSSASACITVSEQDASGMVASIESAGHKVDISGEGTLTLHVDRRKDAHLCVRGHDLRVVGKNSAGGCAECGRIRSRNAIRRRYGNPEDAVPPIREKDSAYARLRELGVLNNKHIPPAYLRASVEQRMDLLRGLLDTDGTVSASNGRVEYSTTCAALRDGVLELLRTLGFKPTVSEKHPRTTYKGVRVNGATAWSITFVAYADSSLFRLERKQSLLLPREGRRASETFRRRVTAVYRVPSVPVRCIQVDSPSHLYLAGRHFVPTHNTEIVNNIVGYFIDQDPSPMLVVQPTLDMGQAWSKDRLAPMLRDTPALQGRVRDVKSRFSDNTILHKKFPGGHLTVCGANSPSSLASRPVRVVLCDEVDRYPVSAGAEGDPVNLAWKRATAFWNKKRLLCSTPTVRADHANGTGSRIELAFEHSDKRFFFLTCPHCGEKQVLKWANVKWPPEHPELAQYACEHCGVLWTEAERRSAIRTGEWIATAPFHGTAGFHIWEAYSPFSNLGKIAVAFMEAKKMPETLKTWVNTVLGESWEEDANKVEAAPLMERREDYGPEVPDGAVVLTAGVDTQDDRLEVEVTGWGDDYETWNVDYRVFYGDPNRPEVWNDLLDYLLTPFTHACGREMPISATCVDTGGHCSEAVYRFCKRYEKYRIFAIKGNPNPGQPILGKPSKRNKGRVKLFPVGVDSAKELLFSRLRIQEPGPGYCHFPLDRDQEYFDQLTAEKRETKYIKGRPRMVWVQTRKRNEALDCRVYSMAAFLILKPAIAALRKRLTPKPTAAREPVAPKVEPKVLHEERVPETVVPKKRIARRRSGGFVTGW